MKKRPLSLIFALALMPFAFGQTVSEDLTWVPTDSTTSATSPDYDFCTGQTINYTVSSGGIGFWNVTSNAPTLSGMIMPASILSTVPTVPMNFTFSQSVCNLRIHFNDLDDNTGIDAESLSSISPAYSGLTGTLTDPGTSSDAVISPTNNGEGWIEWDGPVTSISFIYNRARGCGLIIDSIQFDCCSVCNCNHLASVLSFGNVSSGGVAAPVINLNSNGVAVRSISVELPAYVSVVNPECLKCDPSNQESFGTILSGQPIAGSAGVLYDPFGTGYSRTIRWDFPTPTVVNSNVQLNLRFPPVLELSCCKNDVNYCLNVTFRNEDCTSCEYELCTKNDGSRSEAPGEKVQFHDGVNGNKEDRFNLMPNPAKSKVEISLSDDALVGGKVTFTNTSGMKVMETKITRIKEEFDISKLSPGAYVVMISNNNQVHTKTLVVH